MDSPGVASQGQTQALPCRTLLKALQALCVLGQGIALPGLVCGPCGRAQCGARSALRLLADRMSARGLRTAQGRRQDAEGQALLGPSGNFAKLSTEAGRQLQGFYHRIFYYRPLAAGRMGFGFQADSQECLCAKGKSVYAWIKRKIAIPSKSVYAWISTPDNRLIHQRARVFMRMIIRRRAGAREAAKAA